MKRSGRHCLRWAEIRSLPQTSGEGVGMKVGVEASDPSGNTVQNWMREEASGPRNVGGECQVWRRSDHDREDKDVRYAWNRMNLCNC